MIILNEVKIPPMIRAKPSSLAKVQENMDKRDDLDPMRYALEDVLTAYYKLSQLEAHIDSLFGQGASHHLLRRKSPNETK